MVKDSESLDAHMTPDLLSNRTCTGLAMMKIAQMQMVAIVLCLVDVPGMPLGGETTYGLIGNEAGISCISYL